MHQPQRERRAMAVAAVAGVQQLWAGHHVSQWKVLVLVLFADPIGNGANRCEIDFIRCIFLANHRSAHTIIVAHCNCRENRIFVKVWCVCVCELMQWTNSAVWTYYSQWFHNIVGAILHQPFQSVCFFASMHKMNTHAHTHIFFFLNAISFQL